MKTIRELREARGWTQLELAHRLSVTPSTVYNWERGKYEPPVSTFRRLARALGVSMDDLAVNDDDRRAAEGADAGQQLAAA